MDYTHKFNKYHQYFFNIVETACLNTNIYIIFECLLQG